MTIKIFLMKKDKKKKKNNKDNDESKEQKLDLEYVGDIK